MQRAVYDPSPVQQRKASIRKSLFSGEGGNTKAKEALSIRKAHFQEGKTNKASFTKPNFQEGKNNQQMKEGKECSPDN